MNQYSNFISWNVSVWDSFGDDSIVSKPLIPFAMFVRLSACISVALTTRISVKFDIGDVYENVSVKPKFD
jgi:hypothetical protein